MTVGVVIPCRNEARWIAEVLDALAGQDRLPDDVVVVDDGSTDGTANAIAAWGRAHPSFPLRVVRGTGRGVAAAVNAGITALATDVILRLDGHCHPAADYVRRTVQLASEAGTGVAGGAWTIKPSASTLQAVAIAIAVEHPMGSGGAAYRKAGPAAAGDQPPAPDGQFLSHASAVDTVPFGCFRRALWEELGGLDERLRSNEDYDFNFRVRQLGLNVMLDSTIRCTYYARPTVAALARQYGRYGWWKAKMLRLHPASIRGRQLIPALLVPVLLLASLGVVLGGGRVSQLVLAAYPAAVLLASLHAAITRSTWRSAAWIAGAFFAIQLAWSAGFWISLPIAPAARLRSGDEGSRA